MNRNKAKCPVLLLGWIPRIVIIIARSLKNHGVPVDVVSFSRNVRFHSSAIRDSFLLPNPCSDSHACVAGLREMIIRNGYDMLIPTDDQGLALLADHYDEFAKLLHVACPAPAVLRLVLDKARTQEIASRCGVRVPRSFVAKTGEELKSILSHALLPAVIKPLAKNLREEVFKSCIIRSIDEMHSQLNLDASLELPLLIQEFCEGAGVGIEVLMSKGDPRAVFQHRRLKEFPCNGGFSVLAIAERPQPELVESSISVLRAMNWDGVAMVEYKVNSATGLATLLEVNGRYWGSLGLPVAAGLDFPLYHWQLVHGENPIVPGNYRVGTRWRWTAGYIARLHELMALAARSRQGRDALKIALSDLSEDFSSSVHDASFRWNDPTPGLAELTLAAGHFLIYDAKAVARRVRDKHLRLDKSLAQAN